MNENWYVKQFLEDLRLPNALPMHKLRTLFFIIDQNPFSSFPIENW